MSVLPFPEDLHIVAADGSNPQIVAAISVDSESSGDLQYIRTRLYIQGLVPSSNKIRLTVYNDPNKSTLISSSRWYSLSEIEDYTGDWLGEVNFEMQSRCPLQPSMQAYVYLETQGYTYQEDRFISYVVEDPFRTYPGQATDPIGKAELFVRR